MTNKTITLKDIARIAGISVNSVSRALRDCSDISYDTKKKVKDIADSLGYIPDNTASNLRKGKTNLIAIVFNCFFNPFFQVLNSKVISYIKTLNYKCQLIFCDTSSMEMKHLEHILTNKFSGIISFVEPTLEVSEFFHKRNIPFVLIGIHSTLPYIDCIYTDDVKGGKLVGDFYNKSEFTNALYVTDSFSETSYRRYIGFLETCQNKKSDLIVFNTGENIINKTYQKIISESIDFLFCFSDYLAIRIKNYLLEKNYKKKIKIIGYDNIHKYHPAFAHIDSIGTDYDYITTFACDYIVDKCLEKIDINSYINKKIDLKLYTK